MEKFIPINKKSKKAQKEYYAKERQIISWRYELFLFAFYDCYFILRCEIRQVNSSIFIFYRT